MDPTLRYATLHATASLSLWARNALIHNGPCLTVASLGLAFFQLGCISDSWLRYYFFSISMGGSSLATAMRSFVPVHSFAIIRITRSHGHKYRYREYQRSGQKRKC